MLTSNESFMDGLFRWVVEQGLAGTCERDLLAGLCRKLVQGGVVLDQAAVFVDTLHPVLESEGYYWDAAFPEASEMRSFTRPEAADNAAKWSGSPFHQMVQNGMSELYFALEGGEELPFSILQDLRDTGQTGYFAQVLPLGETKLYGDMDSLFIRWSTRQPGGFDGGQLDALRRAAPVFALSFKSAATRSVVEALVSVYLGKGVAREVLMGRVERGKVESIEAALWFSDMRGYTALSESMPSSELVDMLDDYAEAAIAAIHGAGGDVLKLIGDGVLAIFTDPSPATAAARSVSAWREFQARLEELDIRRRERRLETARVHVGLHFGKVFYGNIGSDDRLDFTVVGPAVNEAARIASLCNSTDHSLVVSDDILHLLPPSNRGEFRCIGTFRLKGVKSEKRLHAVAPT